MPWAGGYSTPVFMVPTSQSQQTAKEPLSLKDWWHELRVKTADEKPSDRMQSAVVGLRHNGESAVIGALLAFIDSDLGGLDLGGRIPLDWLGAVLFYVLSIRDAGAPEGLASDFRAMGQSCTSIAMYRMVQKWRNGQKAVQSIPQNKGSRDPILTASKSF